MSQEQKFDSAVQFLAALAAAGISRVSFAPEMVKRTRDGVTIDLSGVVKQTHG